MHSKYRPALNDVVRRKPGKFSGLEAATFGHVGSYPTINVQRMKDSSGQNEDRIRSYEHVYVSFDSADGEILSGYFDINDLMLATPEEQMLYLLEK